MLYVSLGSQPVVSSVLNDCGLTKKTNLLDHVGEFSFESLLLNINNQFKDFFPPKDEIKIYNGIVNLVNGIPYSIIKDSRNGTLLYDVLPVGKKLDAVYLGAKTKYEKSVNDFTKSILSSNAIVFVRQMYDENENDTLELTNTLKWIYPGCKFYLKHKYAGLIQQKCYDFWKHDLCKGAIK